MAPCVCVGGGGGCSVAQTTTDQYLAAFGYTSPVWPLADAQYQQCASDNVPAGQGNVAAWKFLCVACLKSRSLLYCVTTPGDSYQGSSNASLALGSQIGSSAISGGAAIAGVLGAASSTLLAGVTFGAGAILTAIVDIYQHHAQAEARQAQMLSALCPAATQAIQQIDAAVASGQVTPSAAIAALQQIYTQFSAQTAPYTKSCNAFCGYRAILKAMVACSTWLYQVTAPAAAGQSASNPAAAKKSTPVLIGAAVIAAHLIGVF